MGSQSPKGKTKVIVMNWSGISMKYDADNWGFDMSGDLNIYDGDENVGTHACGRWDSVHIENRGEELA